MAINYHGNNSFKKLLNLLKAKFDTKVDKVEGKGLSTNDLTNELKGNYDAAYTHSQQDHAPANAQENVIEGIQVNGADVTLAGKKANIAIPTGTLASKSEVTEAELSAGLLEKVNASAQGNHSHSNKDLLDTYTQTEANLADAVAKKHAHTFNEEELNKIVAGDKAKWDQAVSDLSAETQRSTKADEDLAKAITDGDAAVKSELLGATSDFDSAGNPDNVKTILGVKAYASHMVDQHYQQVSAQVSGLENGQVATNKSNIETLMSGVDVDGSVDNKIANAVATTYKAAGSAASVTELPALTKANVGKVVNLSVEFTTTADFIEGAGKKHPAGTNVVVANPSGTTYQYDVLAGFVDLSGYTPTAGFVEYTDSEVEAAWNEVFTA